MRTFIVAILFILTFHSYAQHKKIIYVDEAYIPIDAEEFLRKEKSNLFLVATVKSDTAIYKKLRYKEYFGKIDTVTKSQLNKFFHARFSIDSTKTWLIHYRDTMPNPKLMPEESGIVYTDSTKSRHRHVSSLKDDQAIIPKELKKYTKFKNLELLHFFNVTNGYPIKTEEYEWYQDTALLLKKIFSDGMIAYTNLVIHPNGEFYVTAVGKKDRDLNRVLVYKTYKKEKEKARKKHQKLNTERH